MVGQILCQPFLEGLQPTHGRKAFKIQTERPYKALKGPDKALKGPDKALKEPYKALKGPYKAHEGPYKAL